MGKIQMEEGIRIDTGSRKVSLRAKVDEYVGPPSLSRPAHLL